MKPCSNICPCTIHFSGHNTKISESFYS